MSSAENAARVLKDLGPKDWAALRTLEVSLAARPFSTVRQLARTTRLHSEELKFRLSKLNKIGLVATSSQGFGLIASGLDAIALQGLVRKDLISGLGKSLGVGKESDVFEAVSDQGEIFAVKFYRIGRTSFRMIKRKRIYYEHYKHPSWLLTSIRAAKREFEALKVLKPLGVSVPQALSRDRHVILMRKVEGALLAECRELPDPRRIMRDILRNVRLAYAKGGMINGDLSSFNILFDGAKSWIIDWPQAISKECKEAELYIARDVKNVLSIFAKRFGTNSELEAALEYVKGNRGSLRINSTE